MCLKICADMFQDMDTWIDARDADFIAGRRMECRKSSRQMQINRPAGSDDFTDISGI